MGNIFISYTRDDRSRVEPLGAVTLIVILSVIGWFLYSKPSYAKTFKNSIGMEFVLISAGSYTMGSSPGFGRAFERPSHIVKISRPFYLQKTEVTQGQWKAVMENNPSDFKECGDDCPVERVSWEDANKFINKLNKMEGGEAYRLPTEAEWEYAVRAGTTTFFSFGDDKDKLTDYAWFALNSESKTHRVGTKKPNPWGLHDMHGNVLEWVEDDWHKDYNGAPDDGRAWIDEPRGAVRVIRGGSWFDPAHYCRLAARSYYPPGRRYRFLGFRPARSVVPDP
jgi:formylglycine-generating enzyme required for sulfatase activity